MSAGLGAWFAALEARGEDVDILFGRARGAELYWLGVSHVDVDGVGALGLVLSGETGARVTLPTRSPRDPGAAACKLASALELTARTPGWRPARRRWHAPPEIAWWTADELAALQAVTAAARGSLGTCLLWSAHQALADELVPWCGDGIWMVPVNLRRNRDRAATAATTPRS